MNSRNHIKFQESATFRKKSKKINMLRIKKITNLGNIAIIEVNIEVLYIAYFN